MNYLNYLSNRTKELRLMKSISQQTLSDAIGITKASVSRIESANHSVTVETLIAIADFFDVPTDYLLGRTDNPEVNK